jgi:hypothetical protein
MTITQSDLDHFHTFATGFLARSQRSMSLEELFAEWQAERDQAETVASIRRGVADAEAGRTKDLASVDADIRSALSIPAPGDGSGKRITHRALYRVVDDTIEVLSIRHHAERPIRPQDI